MGCGSSVPAKPTDTPVASAPAANDAKPSASAPAQESTPRSAVAAVAAAVDDAVDGVKEAVDGAVDGVKEAAAAVMGTFDKIGDELAEQLAMALQMEKEKPADDATDVALNKRTPPEYGPYTGPRMVVNTGDAAPDFSLTCVGGSEKVSLASLLATKPVLMEFVSVT